MCLICVLYVRLNMIIIMIWFILTINMTTCGKCAVRHGKRRQRRRKDPARIVVEESEQRLQGRESEVIVTVFRRRNKLCLVPDKRCQRLCSCAGLPAQTSAGGLPRTRLTAGTAAGQDASPPRRCQQATGRESRLGGRRHQDAARRPPTTFSRCLL